MPPGRSRDRSLEHLRQSSGAIQLQKPGWERPLRLPNEWTFSLTDPEPACRSMNRTRRAIANRDRTRVRYRSSCEKAGFAARESVLARNFLPRAEFRLRIAE